MVIICRRKDAIEKVALELNITGMMADQSHLGDIEKLTSDILAQFRKMDLLLINTEITKSAPIESISQQVFDEIKDVNFNGAYFTLGRFIAIQNEGASVIFLSSTISPPMASVYASSKAAFIIGVIFFIYGRQSL